MKVPDHYGIEAKEGDMGWVPHDSVEHKLRVPFVSGYVDICREVIYGHDRQMFWGKDIVDLSKSLGNIDAELPPYFSKYLVNCTMPESIDLLVDEDVKKFA